MAVPREPVRALAFLAAVARAVDARDARVAAAAAISERMRRERNGFRANATRSLKRFLIVVPVLMSSSNLTELRQEVDASIQFKHLAATAAVCWLKLMLFSIVT